MIDLENCDRFRTLKVAYVGRVENVTFYRNIDLNVTFGCGEAYNRKLVSIISLIVLDVLDLVRWWF